MKTHRSDARRAPLHRAAASREDAPLQEKQEAIFIRTNRAAKQKVEALLSSFPKGSQDLIRSWIPHAG